MREMTYEMTRRTINNLLPYRGGGRGTVNEAVEDAMRFIGNINSDYQMVKRRVDRSADLMGRKFGAPGVQPTAPEGPDVQTNEQRHEERMAYLESIRSGKYVIDGNPMTPQQIEEAVSGAIAKWKANSEYPWMGEQ